MNKIIFLSICLQLLVWNSIQACPCDSSVTAAVHIENANQIFVGKVIGVNSNWISGGMKYTFLVDKTWKRGADSLLVVNTPWEYECGSTFEKGESYLVYGLKKFSLRTNACMGTKLLQEAEEDLKLLGAGKLPRKSSMVATTGWAMGLMVLLAMGFLAFVILKKRNQS